MDEKIAKYPATEKFKIKDTIGVPHPFCITPKHVAHASDNHYGMLGKAVIEELEQKTKKPLCGMKGCNLWFHEHKQALLVEVDDKRELKDIPELHPYLLSIKEQAEQDGFAGFAFIQKGGS